MPLSPSHVYDIAADLLASVVALFTAAGITLPDRRYVHAGEPAWDCVAAGTRVWTERGAIPIEHVEAGDRVWSWEDGEPQLRDVERRIDKGVLDAVEIDTRHRTIRVTPDHKVLVARPVGDHPAYSGWFRSPGLRWIPEWVAASQLEKGDFLVGLGRLPDSTHDFVHLPDGTVLDEEVGWLLGLLIGDGNVTRYGFNCCVYGETRDRVLELVERRWGYEGGMNPHNGTWFYAPPLRDLFATVGLHYQSPWRRVPSLIWASPRKVQQSFLDGYADADGYRQRSGYISFAASSEGLIGDVRQLAMAQGSQVSNLHVEHRTRPITIRGKQVKSARPAHRFSVYPNAAKDFTVLRKRAANVYGADFRPERVYEVRRAEQTSMFDLTIEGTHNFIADGIVVHNCEQVVVTVPEAGLTHAFPGETAAIEHCSPPRHVALQVWINRCVPVPADDGTPPTADALDSSAEVVLADLWSLAYVLWEGYRNQEWGSRCATLILGPVSVAGPEGGHVAVTADVFLLVT